MSTTIPISSDSSTEDSPPSNTLSDRDLLQLKTSWLSGDAWHKDCPSELTKGWGNLSEAEAWQRWSVYLAKNQNSPLGECLIGKVDPLDWGLPLGESSLAQVATWRSEFDAILKAGGGNAHSASLESMLEAFLSQVQERPDQPAQALKAVVLAYRLPLLAQLVKVDSWWKIVSLLSNLVAEASTVSSEELEATEVLTAVLLSGELPLVLSVVLPELQLFRSDRTTARKSLGEGLTAATDGEGLIHATLLPGHAHADGKLDPIAGDWRKLEEGVLESRSRNAVRVASASSDATHSRRWNTSAFRTSRLPLAGRCFGYRFGFGRRPAGRCGCYRTLVEGVAGHQC